MPNHSEIGELQFGKEAYGGTEGEGRCKGCLESDFVKKCLLLTAIAMSFTMFCLTLYLVVTDKDYLVQRDKNVVNYIKKNYTYILFLASLKVVDCFVKYLIYKYCCKKFGKKMRD